jgi:hypothetical protein
MESVDRVLEAVLRGHEPYPAWVVRQPFTFVRANAAAETLFPGLTQLSPAQLIDVWFGPGPFRDQVVNWPEVVRAGLTALRHAAADTGDAEVIRLLQRAQAHTQDRLVMSETRGGIASDLTGLWTRRADRADDLHGHEVRDRHRGHHLPTAD